MQIVAKLALGGIKMSKIINFDQVRVEDMWQMGSEIHVVTDKLKILAYQGKYGFKELKEKLMTGDKVLLGVNYKELTCTMPEEMTFSPLG